MAIAKVGTPEEYQTAEADENEATATITISQTPTEGNTLIALATVDKSMGTITYPSGWSVAEEYNGTDISGFIAYKVAGASEGTTFDFTSDGTPRSWAIWSCEYSGMDDTAPFDVSSQDNSEPSAVTSQSTGSTGTLSQADNLALAVLGCDTGTNWKPYTQPSGWTEEWEEPNTPIGGDPACRIASLVTTATTALNPSYSTTDTGDQCWAAVAVFKEAAAATPAASYRPPPLRNNLIRR